MWLHRLVMSIARLLFGSFALVLGGGLTYYLYRRLVHDLTGSIWLRRAGAAWFIAFFALLPLTRLWAHHQALARDAALLVSSWWGLCLFMLVALATIEVLRPLRRLARPKAAATTAAPEAISPGLAPPVEGHAVRDAAPAPPGGPVAALEADGSIALTAAATVSPPLPLPAPEDFESLTRRRFVARATAAGALVFGGGLSSYGAWRAFAPPEVTELAIPLPGLPRALDGFTVVQLSDLHIGVVLQDSFVERLVTTVNALKPDLVAITGDLVDGSPRQLGSIVQRLTGLSSRHGTYFVSGNHDYYSGWERWAVVLERMGLNVLRNRVVRIGSAAAGFDLIGVDDWRGDYDLSAATAARDPSRASILLAHQPNGLEDVAAHGIGLQLSGHTHGGQLFPGTWVSDLVWGARSAGLSWCGQTQLYTNRGCGFVGPPMRVGSPPEIARITLLAG